MQTGSCVRPAHAMRLLDTCHTVRCELCSLVKSRAETTQKLHFVSPVPLGGGLMLRLGFFLPLQSQALHPFGLGL